MINRPGRLPKRKIFPLFGFKLRELGGDDLVSAEICHRWRDKIAQHGIDERSKRGKQAAAEENSNHAAAHRFGLGKLVTGHFTALPVAGTIRNRIAGPMAGSRGQAERTSTVRCISRSHIV